MVCLFKSELPYLGSKGYVVALISRTETLVAAGILESK